MDQNSNRFEPFALVWTLVGAVSDAMNLRNLREELYGESANLLPPPADHVHVTAPVILMDRRPPMAERSVRVARFGAEIP